MLGIDRPATPHHADSDGGAALGWIDHRHDSVVEHQDRGFGAAGPVAGSGEGALAMAGSSR